MADDFYSGIYNPDVLSCIANLSNDEVFTPPDVANAMLDLLPQELFASTETTFLDPACKSGVFLREIAKRLLAAHFPGYKEALDAINAKKSAGTVLTAAEETYLTEFQAGVDHIFHHQLFGIAITELTSLLSRRGVYCSKFPNGEYSVSHFDDAEGNIRFKRIDHRWKDGKCVFCGTSKDTILGAEGRGDILEAHAYEWIHTTKPEEILKMKFDVIVSNPPYQLSDSGHGVSAKPIYQLFVEQSKKLNPHYLLMIIPARWYAGGKGLDSFRADMLSDSRISTLVDYENSDEIFNGVDIAGGICYFLWDKDHSGPCKVINFYNKEPAVSIRKLNEYDTFIRHDKAVEIVHKVQIMHGKNKYLDSRVSARKPFGLPTNYEQSSSGVPCWFIQRIGLKLASAKDVVDTNGYLSKWKLLIPPAPIAGQTDFSKPVGFYYDGNTRIAKPGECCTESWLVAGAFDTESETLSYKSYIFTKTVRFLLLQTVVSQHVTKKNFCFVPDLGHYSGEYTDDILRKKWDITDDEWAFIDSRIGSVGGDSNA